MASLRGGPCLLSWPQPRLFATQRVRRDEANILCKI